MSYKAVSLVVLTLLVVAHANGQTVLDENTPAIPSSASNTETQSNPSQTQQETASDKEQEAAASPTANAIAQGLIDDQFVGGDLGEALRKKVDELLEQTRFDQDTMRSAVRQINTNLERVSMRTEPVECNTVPLDHSASPALLGSQYLAEHPNLLTPFVASGRTDALRSPIAAEHPEVLSWPAVQRTPDVLYNPAARKNWEVLRTAAVTEDPRLFVKPGARNPLESTGNTCSDFVRDVSRINRNLLIETYQDSIKQNANLSNQVRTRLEELVEDSETLTTDMKRERFLYEYTLLTERYLQSRQFRVGFGATYSYLPNVEYSAFEPVDLSSFLTAAPGGSDRVFVSPDFSNEGSLSPFVSAKAPFFDIDFIYPDLSTTETSISPVQFLGTDATGTQILAQSTVTSMLGIEYEIGIRVGIGNLLERRKVRSALKDTNELGSYYPKSQRNRFDWGLGVGVTGFDLENTVVTDVRLRSDGTSRFGSLTSAGTVTTSNGSAFSTTFLIGYYKFRISDEFELGIDFRKYAEDAEEGGRIVVSGDTFSITAAYYPTFQRKKKTSEGDPAPTPSPQTPANQNPQQTADQ